MESHGPSATSLNSHQHGSHSALPEGVHFGADSLETWFNSGCVAPLGPLPSLGLFSTPNCKRGWGCHLRLPSSGEGCSASCRQDLGSSRDRNPATTPFLLPWFSVRSSSDTSSILRAKVNYLLVLSTHLQTSYLGHKHLGKHIRPNKPGSWDPEPFDKHLRAPLDHGGVFGHCPLLASDPSLQRRIRPRPLGSTCRS